MPTRPPKHRPAGWTVPQAQQAAERDRGSASARGYGRDWQKLRLVILERDPLCIFCWNAGRTTASEEVDHILTIEDRPDLRLDPENLRGLCKACHSSHTARQRRR